ncbi:tRNA (adenosine(37)-N6)-methyltransferase TrmM [Vibrio sp. 10N.286.49.B3]|uniref:tRNA1(Val) (adenine(37)-N6)-methyltransferase n=1 Tax=Vibrio sp. 10N.286.49.B3 TaxID=1880855 RepID=UPI000C81846B|nr:methyltransferase [Vibrio sp. 10N.286.49.B3]PMH39750.1 tRNA (adenosine(37)-N6)-methyltransferase TrmM [Vibrio sp. 10N.286.49.B3]
MKSNESSNSANKTKDFQFKQFSIYGGNSGMPVSTDGVLLGAWSIFTQDQQVLDIGTGTGLLSLMIAQRYPEIDITAVDIDDFAYQAAHFNCQQSPWANRIQLQQGDVLTLSFDRCFDGIICNPPYFVNGAQAQNQQRATARHTDSLEHKALLIRCWELLNEQGHASFILPIVEGEAFIHSAQQLGWFLARRCDVKPSPKKPVHRILFELSKKETTCQSATLTIHAENGYSDAFIALSKDFYLKM